MLESIDELPALDNLCIDDGLDSRPGLEDGRVVEEGIVALVDLLLACE